MSEPMTLACPHCHRRNRLPAERLDQAPRCGACKEALFSGAPVDLGGANFNAHANADLPLVVDFWASWCGPCQQFAPVFAQAAGNIEPRARLAKVDTEAAQELAARFAIRSIPTLLIMHRGKEVARLNGALPPSDFQRWLDGNLPSA
ncbi:MULTISPECIES: thioredoxin TrxC [Halopseudomonas]|jgi:thioredoxin 2|uniref:Thioredoxin n=1 Tax=Halopseudomonas bauzanensis TaxID=653930 RepID=A0A031MFK9_9GAMM|nr:MULTISPECIES: thioredoxin TrxC [Halopseudomonas]EZQ18780.1 thioredoxin [Halopseudomonas bauzanensis]WGK62395.1 thioredoxin TrxC [Halopseudomonas sp. SMJS2]SES25504.1 thioredoxin [Halopseudomonas bauzanensis]SFM25077.1 thioredoxin [Halopseudomonas bauzanensis]